MKFFWNALTSIMSASIVLLATLLVGVRLLGFSPYTVLSSSMEPAYPVGSLIYIRQIPSEDINVGDAITFVMNEDLLVATHRVVEVDSQAMSFRTKGDANDIVDGAPVHFNNVLGKVVFSIPYLGYVANYVSSSQGRYIAIVIVLFLLLLLVLPGLFTADKKANRNGEENDVVNPDTDSDVKRATLH